jgi:hypothetical protein
MAYHYTKLFPKAIRRDNVARSVKLRVLPIAAIWVAFLARGVEETVAERLTYAVAFTFAIRETEKEFEDAAKEGVLSMIQAEFLRVFHGPGRHQRFSDMTLSGDCFAFRYVRCAFMEALEIFGVPTTTVGRAFCDADRIFWNTRLPVGVTLIKPEETIATGADHCSVEFLKR